MPFAPLLAALLCGLLVTGCGDPRVQAVTVDVELDAALVAALPSAQCRTEGGDEPSTSSSPRHRGFLDGCNADLNLSGGGGGKDGLVAVVIVVVAVVTVVVVAAVVDRIASTIADARHRERASTFALNLGGGPAPDQLLLVRAGHALPLDRVLAQDLRQGAYAHATLQRRGSPVALPVVVVLIGRRLLVQPESLRPAQALPPDGQGR